MNQLTKEDFLKLLETDERNILCNEIWRRLKKAGCQIVQITPEEKLAKELGAKLFVLHSHAEIVNDQNPEQIVYREQDVINLLRSLGFPTPNFG